MATAQVTVPWTDEAWLQDTHIWIHDVLQQQGIPVQGPIEQPHVRPWATVLRVPTGAGDVYFKAMLPTLAHEPAVTEALARWRPDCMPRVIAVDTARDWMLVADMGDRLRSHIHNPADLWHWHEVLPLYADVQIEMAARVAELLALGIRDWRLARLPALYSDLLTDRDALLVGQADGLTHGEYERLQALLPWFEAACAQLATFRIPETIDHNDFHDGNIFIQDGRYTFGDWGDSCLTHPFFSMLIPPRSTAYRLKLADDAPALIEMCEIYLAAWAAYGSPARLRAALAQARPLAMFNRALN